MLRTSLPPNPEELQVDDDEIRANYTRENCDCRGPRENKCRRKPKPVVFLDSTRVEVVYMCRLSTLELLGDDDDTAFIFDNGEWKPLT